MTKFKVGDKVVRVTFYGNYDDVDRTGTITAVHLKDTGNYVDVSWDDPKSTDVEFNTVGMCEEKFELLKDKKMSQFKVGDRVVMSGLNSKYTYKEGTVKGFLYQNTDDERLVVHFDCNEPDHFVNFPSSDFVLSDEVTVQEKRNNEAVKYAEWFKYAIRNINAAGGNPMIFIDKLPPDVIDSMVRNNLFIFYRGKDV